MTVDSPTLVAATLADAKQPLFKAIESSQTVADTNDRPTLEQLVSDHLPAGLNFAIRLTGDPLEAEEIVQDSLVRVLKNWQSFRGDSQFRTWFFRIVINVFRDKYRHSASKSKVTKEAQQIPSYLADVKGGDPSFEAQASELSDLIAARISALPPRQREVLVLMTYETLKPREAADVLGISEANVRSTLHIARERLRNELAPYMQENPNESR